MSEPQSEKLKASENQIFSIIPLWSYHIFFLFSDIKYNKKTRWISKLWVFPSQSFRSSRHAFFLSFIWTYWLLPEKNSCTLFGIFGKAWQALLWLVILSEQHHLRSKGLTQQVPLLISCRSKKELALDQLLGENFWMLRISCLIRVLWYAWGLGSYQVCQQYVLWWTHVFLCLRLWAMLYKFNL